MTRLRIAVNDYAGHPFQIQLARALADLGHEVTFLYCSTNVTPHGDLMGDRNGLEVVPVSTGATFDKYRLRRRLVHELRYGWRCARIQRRRRCDVVLASNVPVMSLVVLQILNRSARHVLWLQDIQSGLVGLALDGPHRLVGTVIERLERRAATRADAIVAVAPSMVDRLAELGVDAADVVVIENWAPLEQLPAGPKTSAWSRRHGLDQAFVFLYCGTLGAKHRPELLVQLCQEFADIDDVRVVTVSEGKGADWLAEQKRTLGLGNLLLLPYQSFVDLPDVLASADVLVAVLDPRAGSCSIPSKVLTYLCAGRPILASLPPDNSSAELIANESRSGLVSTAAADFILQARRLHRSPELRALLAGNGRLHAEKAFDIDQISRRFLEVIDPDGSPSPSARATGGT